MAYFPAPVPAPALVLQGLVYIETVFLYLMSHGVRETTVACPRTKELAPSVTLPFSHFALCYEFVFNYGIKGIGYASTISNLLIYIFMLLYSRQYLDI